MSTVGRDDSHFVLRQKLLGEDVIVKRDVVMMKQPGVFSPKFGATSSHVFTHSPRNVALEPGIDSLACWDSFFLRNPLDVKVMAMLILFFTCLAFFGIGDLGLLHWDVCCFVSGS